MLTKKIQSSVLIVFALSIIPGYALSQSYPPELLEQVPPGAEVISFGEALSRVTPEQAKALKDPQKAIKMMNKSGLDKELKDIESGVKNEFKGGAQQFNGIMQRHQERKERAKKLRQEQRQQRWQNASRDKKVYECEKLKYYCRYQSEEDLQQYSSKMKNKRCSRYEKRCEGYVQF